MNRRRRKRPPACGGRKAQVNLLPVLVIIGLSVCAGYLTARYVVYPILGYEPAELNVLEKLRPGGDGPGETKTAAGEPETGESQRASAQPAPQPETEKKEIPEPKEESRPEETKAASSETVPEDKAPVRQTAGYALQFGSYSTKAAAAKSLKQLKSSGIEAKIVEKDGAYKIIGKLFDTKEEAKACLNSLDESVGAFVTAIET